MDRQSKKDLIQGYKHRKVIGGVFLIRNTVSNKILLQSAVDLQGGINRFEFSKNIDSCVYLPLKKDWDKYTKDAFVLEVLDRLEKKEEQTQKDFSQEVKELEEIWREKFDGSIFY